jgi:hypothetical protein
LSGPEDPENDDLSAVGPPSDLPDSSPDTESNLEDADLGRYEKKVAIADRRQSMGERGLTFKVVLPLAVFACVAIIVFMFLAGFRVVHIPDSAWPYLFGALPITAIVALIARFIPPKKPSY